MRRVELAGIADGLCVHATSKVATDAGLQNANEMIRLPEGHLFRNQPMSAQSHAALAGQFGELEAHPALPASGDDPSLVRFEKGADISGFENLGTMT